ncbi:MAG: hypothetical protein AB1451_08180 [Nitrospirota bacterium]
MLRSFLAALLVASALVAGCSDDDTPNPGTLALAFTGLSPLENGYHYEGWAVTSAGAVSTGKFNVGANGTLVTTSGSAIPSGEFATGLNLSSATDIVITIEPPGDTDTTPATTKMFAGPVVGNSASLAVGGAQALGSDFTTAVGSFILATPTDGDTMPFSDPNNTNERSGIWFLDLSTGTPAPMTLPTLPAGWKYEGWVVINGTPVSTGTFTSASAADDSALFSGATAGPPFPGEDFLQNAPSGLTFPTDLRGTTAVISIEPSPDDSAAPFTLKPLVGTVPASALDHVTYALTNQASGNPTGTATIR